MPIINGGASWIWEQMYSLTSDVSFTPVHGSGGCGSYIFFFFLIKNIILIEIISQLQFEIVYLNFNKYSRLDNFVEIKFVSNNLLVKFPYNNSLQFKKEIK